MRSKNSVPITPQERAHLERVKAAPCSWCAGRGGFAHHLAQGDHWRTVSTCWECHQGPLGVHGDGTIMRLTGITEEDAINITHALVNGSRVHHTGWGTASPSRAKLSSTRTTTKTVRNPLIA